MNMERRDIDPAAPWQTACWIYRITHVPMSTVKNLALQGLIRFKVDHSRFPSFYYNVADINRYIEETRRDGHPESTRFRTVEAVASQARERAATRPRTGAAR
jgi:hypothetical protein